MTSGLRQKEAFSTQHSRFTPHAACSRQVNNYCLTYGLSFLGHLEHHEKQRREKPQTKDILSRRLWHKGFTIFEGDEGVCSKYLLIILQSQEPIVEIQE